MNNATEVRLQAEAIIGSIEKAVDAANMLAMDMAINAFEAEYSGTVPRRDLKTIKSLTEQGLRASDEIGRLMNGLHVS